jgi:hypothetical protein
MPLVFPYFLQTDHVSLQLVEPRNDLLPTFRPPRPDERIDVQLHYPQRGFTHLHRLPALRSCRQRSRVYRAPARRAAAMWLDENVAAPFGRKRALPERKTGRRACVPVVSGESFAVATREE